MDDGTHFYVDAGSGEVVARRTRFWRVYDFMWGLHIMDLQGRKRPTIRGSSTFALLALVMILMALVLLPLATRKGSRIKPAEQPATSQRLRGSAPRAAPGGQSRQRTWMLGPAMIADTSPMTRASNVGRRRGKRGEGVGRRAVGLVVARQHLDQPVLEARALVEVGHARVVGLGQRRGLGDRLVEPAELVDQPQLPRGPAVPHAALRDAVDLGDALARATAATRARKRR